MSIFTQSSFSQPNQSTFNLSHDSKLTLKMGDLVPILCEPVLPGDVWKLSSSQLLRLMPTIAPIMHEVNVYTHYFYVPNRILWRNWKKFIEDDSIDDPNYLMPIIKGTAEHPFKVTPNSLADYLNLPVTKDYYSQAPSYLNLDLEVSALPFIAYQMIYNEYYRDQNLIPEIDFEEHVYDGELSYNAIEELTKIRKRAWNHDYFTSCLPFAQKGVEVTLPLITNDLTTVDVLFKDINEESARFTDAFGNGINMLDVQIRDGQMVRGDTTRIDNSNDLEVDMSQIQANAASIIDLRRSIKTQEFLEKNARAGTRYTEQLLAHWGVHSSDGRLQRPEYLGGQMSPIMISEVVQQSATTDNSAQGNLAGHGLNIGNTDRIVKRFEEWGYIIGIMSVMPKTSYYQGVPRDYTKLDKLSFAWPTFEHIGEQNVLNQEIMWNHPNKKDTFGYIPRYAEYKYIPNRVHGDFTDTLDFWHLSRKFDKDAPPQLNSTFIECNPRTDIFAVQETEFANILVNMYHNIECKRKLSFYSNPTLL